MTRFLILVAIVALAVVHTDACGPSPFVPTPSQDWIPYYEPDDGSVGTGSDFRVRRHTEGKLHMFNLIDADGDKYITACEWIQEGGSVKNFVECLNDDDTDGDEKISLEEFKEDDVTFYTLGKRQARVIGVKQSSS